MNEGERKIGRKRKKKKKKKKQENRKIGCEVGPYVLNQHKRYLFHKQSYNLIKTIFVKYI